jgi:hypothetical protein
MKSYASKFVTNYFMSQLKKFFFLFKCLFCFAIVIPLQAQLDEGQQEIIKDFEAQLEEANRVVVKPIVEPTVVVKKSYAYNVTIVPLELKYPEPVILPLAAEPDLPFEVKKLYIKLGYGNVQNPKAIIKYYKTDQNKVDYFFDIDHYGLNNNLKLANQIMSNSDGKLGLNYRVKENMQINARLNGQFEKRKFYFINQSAGLTENLGSDRNKIMAGTNFELFNPEQTASGIDYKIKLGYSFLNFSSPHKKSELTPKFGLDISKTIGNWKLILPFNANAVLQNDIDDLYGFDFNPHLKMNNQKLWLKAGAMLYNDKNLKTKVWPSVNASYALSGKKLHLFIDVDQKNLSNSLHHIANINPWLNLDQAQLTANLKQTISGGIKSESSFLGIEAEAGYAKVFNQINFINSNPTNIAQAIATPKNTNAVFVKSNVDFAFSNNLNIGGAIVKNFYTEEQYGIPSLELNAFAKIDLFKNVIALRPSLTIRDKSKTLLTTVEGTNEISFNNQVDLSNTLEINISKKFALYAEANNILNNKYTSFYGYPSIGINFNGGLVLKF